MTIWFAILAKIIKVEMLTGILTLASMKVKRGFLQSNGYCLNPYIIKSATTCKLVSPNWVHLCLCKFLDLFILETMKVNREFLTGILTSTKGKWNMGFFQSSSYCWNSCIVKIAIVRKLVVSPNLVHLNLCKSVDLIHSTKYIQTQHHFTNTYIK